MTNYTISLTLHDIIAANRLLYLFLWLDDSSQWAMMPFCSYPEAFCIRLRRGYRVLLLRIAVDYAILKAFPAGFARHNSLNS